MASNDQRVLHETERKKQLRCLATQPQTPGIGCGRPTACYLTRPPHCASHSTWIAFKFFLTPYGYQSSPKTWRLLRAYSDVTRCPRPMAPVSRPTNCYLVRRRADSTMLTLRMQRHRASRLADSAKNGLPYTPSTMIILKWEAFLRSSISGA